METALHFPSCSGDEKEGGNKSADGSMVSFRMQCWSLLFMQGQRLWFASRIGWSLLGLQFYKVSEHNQKEENVFFFFFWKISLWNYPYVDLEMWISEVSSCSEISSSSQKSFKSDALWLLESKNEPAVLLRSKVWKAS